MRSILIIEEDKTLLDHLSTILKLAGHKIIAASSGQSGVTYANSELPDLILSDLQFSDIDGYGLLHLIQKNTDLRHIPFIFMSSDSSKDKFRKAMEMGADDFLSKPFTDLELLNAIESRLKKRDCLIDQFKGKGEHDDPELDYHHALKRLLENSQSNKYDKREIIFSQGNYPQYLFYVKKGMVKAFMRNEEGKELTTQLYGPGDFIGYIALLEDKPYNITTRTLDACEIQLISKKSFFHLVKSNTIFSLEVINVLAKHNSQKAEKMMQLAYNSLRKRVAQSLLLLKNKFSPNENDNFIIPITREELANISGTTTESLIRTLSDFKSENLIEIHGRSIKLINERALNIMPN